MTTSRVAGFTIPSTSHSMPLPRHRRHLPALHGSHAPQPAPAYSLPQHRRWNPPPKTAAAPSEPQFWPWRERRRRGQGLERRGIRYRPLGDEIRCSATTGKLSHRRALAWKELALGRRWCSRSVLPSYLLVQIRFPIYFFRFVFQFVPRSVFQSIPTSLFSLALHKSSNKLVHVPVVLPLKHEKKSGFFLRLMLISGL